VTTRVSVGSLGQESNASSSYASISDDGRHVAFRTGSTNITANATVFWDVYVHDRDPDLNGVMDEGNGQTRLVSHDANHAPGNHNSGVSAASERSHALSGSGSHVAFGSMASNLVAGDTNGTIDVFFADLCPCTAIDLGYGRTANNGVSPQAEVCGDLSAGSLWSLELHRAPPASPGALVVGLAPVPTPFLGGTLVPSPVLLAPPITTDPNGAYTISVSGPSGLTIVMQWLVLDLSPPASRLAFSNAIGVTIK